MTERLTFELPASVLEKLVERAALIVLERLAAAAPPASRFVTVFEAAELLRCRRQRVDDLLSQRRLSRFKEGGRTLVSRAEVEALVLEESARRVASALPRASGNGSGSGVAG